MNHSKEVGHIAYLQQQKEKVERKAVMLVRLKEKMIADPNGIWEELYKEMKGI